MKNRLLGLVLASTFVVSLGYSFFYHDHPRVDAKAYDDIGWNLASGYGYVENAENADSPEMDEAVLRVGPGYEFFLAGVYKLFGHNIWVVWILHALLRVATVYFIYAISIILFPERVNVGVLAAALFAFSPDLVVINGLLLTETLFLALLISSVYVSLKLFESGKLSLGLLAALSWGLCVLTRPVALLPLVIIVVVLMWQRKWKNAAILFILPAIMVGLWSAKMTRLHGGFILTTTAGGYDLWVGNNPDSRGGFEKTPEIVEARRTYRSVELDKIGRRKYFEFLFGHPLQFAELQLRKASLYFSLVRPSGLWFHLYPRPWHMRVTLFSSAVWTAVLFVLGISGAALMFLRRKDITARLVLALAALQPLAVIPIIVETRYRYALFPFLALFGAYFFLERFIDKRILYVVIGILLAFTAYDIAYNFTDVYSKINAYVL